MKAVGYFGFLLIVLFNAVLVRAQAVLPNVFSEEYAKYFIDATYQSIIPAAVTSAYDFSKADCNGVEHHLYSELEEGNVILLEFAMSCTSCENARIMFEDIEAQFSDSHPGRFHIYTMSYTNSTTCDKVKLWPVVKNHGNPVFVGVADQLSYYGGFGMPTIVIVGGKDHNVYYINTKGIIPDSAEIELARIKNAISEAFSTSSVEMAQLPEEPFILYPNPAHDKIALQLPSVLPMQPQMRFDADVRIINYMGAQVLQKSVKVYGDVTMDISTLNPGVYRLNLLKQDGTQKNAVFVKY